MTKISITNPIPTDPKRGDYVRVITYEDGKNEVIAFNHKGHIEELITEEEIKRWGRNNQNGITRYN